MLGVALAACGVSLALRYVQGSAAFKEELLRRAEQEGLAIAEPHESGLWMRPFDSSQPTKIKHPYRRAHEGAVLGFGIARFSQDGKLMVGNDVLLDGARSDNSIQVMDFEGNLVGELRGEFINLDGLAISPDGKKIAFSGTYKPPGSGILATPQNMARWITGLQVGDLRSQQIETLGRLSCEQVEQEMEIDNPGWRSLSWSPDSSRIIFERKGKIGIYDLNGRTATPFAEGFQPAWSPDGKWIAYLASDGTAMLYDTEAKLSKELMNGSKMETRVSDGIAWSPDSDYLLILEKLREEICPYVIYRLRDGATFRVFYRLIGHYQGWLKLRIPATR